jgi:hypothetical protein
VTVEIKFTLCTPQLHFIKVQEREMFFRFLHPITDRKKGILHIFHVPIFTELEPYLTHLAHKGNTQSDFFLCDRLNFHSILFCWGSDNIQPPMVEILSLCRAFKSC